MKSLSLTEVYPFWEGGLSGHVIISILLIAILIPT